MTSGAIASSCARSSELLRIFSGCVTARPAARAACFTGVGAIWRSRPTGRSGCETTRATSCPAASNASKVGRANCGVPQKTSLRQRAAFAMTVLPDAFALHLANLAQIETALERAHAEDEQHAVKMVDFMLEAARQKLVAIHLEPLAVFVLRANANLCGAHHLLANVGKAQAALLFVLPALAHNNLRIDQHKSLFAILSHAQVDDGDAF